MSMKIGGTYDGAIWNVEIYGKAKQGAGQKALSQSDRLEQVKNLQLKRRFFQEGLQMMKTADPESGITQEQLEEMELRVEEVSADMKATMESGGFTEQEALSSLSRLQELGQARAEAKRSRSLTEMPDLDSYEREMKFADGAALG